VDNQYNKEKTQYISLWFGDLLVSYVLVEAGQGSLLLYRSQQPPQGWLRREFVLASQLDHKVLIQASIPREWFFASHNHLWSTS
jgi:hypothetical protein